MQPSSAAAADGTSAEGSEDNAVARYKATHRAASKNWELPARFPDGSVLAAYAQPKVDESKDKFQFLVPDVPVLTEYCTSRFGWSRVRVCSQVHNSM